MKAAQQVSEFLDGKGANTFQSSLFDEELIDRVERKEFDLLIALGGDGSMLRAGHFCAPNELPILGINLGRLGFLVEVQRDEWPQALERVIAGDFWIENRMMLKAEHLRSDKVLSSWDVLNECFVGRGAVTRSVRLRTEIDGRFMTTYVADGLILATATGSTAYALAAGGPVLPPELRNILLVPVAPHLSVDRAVVLHEGSHVCVTVGTDHEAIVSVDGLDPEQVEDQDQVRIQAGEFEASFIRFHEPDYFYRNLTSRMHKNPAAEKRT